MASTFEELVAEEIDDLWRGALFLSGGDRTGARELLLRTVRDAFHDWSGEDRRFGRWAQTRLTRGYLEDAEPTEATPPSRWPSGRLDPVEEPYGLDLSAICAGAAAVGVRSRAALWLVVVRRRSYQETADALGWDREALVQALSARDDFMRAALATGGDGRGADEAAG